MTIESFEAGLHIVKLVPPQLRGSDIRDVCVDLVETSDSRISAQPPPPPARPTDPPRAVCVPQRETLCVFHTKTRWAPSLL